MMPGGLVTDLYELNMAASYLARRMSGSAVFSLFVRKLPPNRGFLVAAGLEDCVSFLERFGFDAGEQEWLAQHGFSGAALERLAGLRFTGEVRAVPEGRVVFAGEPLLEIRAPIAEAQLVETFLLNQVTFQTTLATKAARCRVAAAGKIGLVDFSLRRTQGVEAGMAVARLSAMVGFAATSNVEAARRFGLTAAGTMTHSYVEAFPDEVSAFVAFAEDRPGSLTFLVDTYETLGGVRAAIDVIRRLGQRHGAAVRLDSGDLSDLARRTRRLLDDAGLPWVRIFASGGLDEHDVARFVRDGVPVDAVGIGTRMGVSADAPALDSAYKLVAFGDRPVMKLSAGKATLPGAKQVFRGPDGDIVARPDEPAPPGAEPLLEVVMRNGRRVGPPDWLTAARARFEADLARVPDPALDLDHPISLSVRVSPRLQALAAQVEAEIRARVGETPEANGATPAAAFAGQRAGPATTPERAVGSLRKGTPPRGPAQSDRPARPTRAWPAPRGALGDRRSGVDRRRGATAADRSAAKNMSPPGSFPGPRTRSKAPEPFSSGPPPLRHPRRGFAAAATGSPRGQEG
jgi:nicotinate phosphoribosyltransferase